MHGDAGRILGSIGKLRITQVFESRPGRQGRTCSGTVCIDNVPDRLQVAGYAFEAIQVLQVGNQCDAIRLHHLVSKPLTF